MIFIASRNFKYIKVFIKGITLIGNIFIFSSLILCFSKCAKANFVAVSSCLRHLLKKSINIKPNSLFINFLIFLYSSVKELYNLYIICIYCEVNFIIFIINYFITFYKLIHVFSIIYFQL